ncbi:MAG: protein phosphatase 1 regulatory subunit 42 [Actinomycetia bacterium]|nr:protein phosphatase 1 regulatory subunit 42 [Actinomycetes bacterium]
MAPHRRLLSRLTVVAVSASVLAGLSLAVGATAASAATIADTFPDSGLAQCVADALNGGPSGDPTDPYVQSDIDLIADLSCQSYGISALDGIDNFTGLLSLNLSGNQISDISVLGPLTSLQILVLSGNQIDDATAVAGLTGLTKLDLSNNQLTYLPDLSALTALTQLDLSNNQLTDVSPLSGLTALTEANLSNNQILDISPLNALFNPPSGTTNLTNLSILGQWGQQLALPAICADTPWPDPVVGLDGKAVLPTDLTINPADAIVDTSAGTISYPTAGADYQLAWRVALPTNTPTSGHVVPDGQYFAGTVTQPVSPADVCPANTQTTAPASPSKTPTKPTKSVTPVKSTSTQTLGHIEIATGLGANAAQGPNGALLALGSVLMTLGLGAAGMMVRRRVRA